jgi:hypothetical protein
MKNWNLLKLWVEVGLRFIALFISTVISIFVTVGIFNILNLNDVKFNEFKDEIIKEPAGVHLLIILFITPLLVSIFILVATRKFKEINQLIEENKKL